VVPSGLIAMWLGGGGEGSDAGLIDVLYAMARTSRRANPRK